MEVISIELNCLNSLIDFLVWWGNSINWYKSSKFSYNIIVNIDDITTTFTTTTTSMSNLIDTTKAVNFLIIHPNRYFSFIPYIDDTTTTTTTTTTRMSSLIDTLLLLLTDSIT